MTPDSTGSISVVITAYECARYLGQAITSVLTQSRPPQQVIVVDDGSADNCAAVAGAFGEAIQYIHQANGGTGAARNTGLRLATGDWLALLDGDDYWQPNKLADQWTAVQADPGLEAVFGHAQVFVSPDLDPAEAARLQPALAPMPGYYASTLLIRRAAFWRVGEFTERLRIGEFIEWYGRALDANLRLQLLPGVLAWRRMHATNSTLLNRVSKPEYARVLKAMLDRRRSAERPDAA